MQVTLQRLIKKLELNESAISTMIGGIALLIVTVLFVGYFKDYKSNSTIEPKPDITSGESITVDQVDPNQAGQISSAAISKYQVQADESLWSIAQKEYQDGYKWVDIAVANQLENPDLIAEGLMLDIPRASDLGVTPPELSESSLNQSQQLAPDKTENSNLKTYTVVNNDSLWKISQSLYNDGYKWSQIWQANKDLIKNPDILPVGIILNLPAP